MTEDELAILNDSFERCMERPDFMDLFYDHFIASSQAVAESFARTDLRGQKKALRSSLYLIMSAVARRETDFSFLQDIAERHSRKQLGIQPYLYDLWVDSLMFAAERTDPRFDAETERIWRGAIGPAVEYMISHY